MVYKARMPIGLGHRGKKLWTDMIEPEMKPDVVILLEETCRIADRLHELDRAVRGKPIEDLLVVKLPENDYAEHVHVTIEVEDLMNEARQNANLLKQMLVTIRTLNAPAKAAAKPAPAGAAKGGPASPDDEVGARRGWRAG